GKIMVELPLDEDGNKIVRIGHSPDPDDAFMFHAMTTNAFPTPGYNFVHELQDIETLNHRAMNQDLEVSAVSIHAYPDIADHYALMNCGASMGEGYGPMIVCKEGVSEDEARNNVIAVPGLKTSAYLGLRLAWGDCEVAVVPFDEIIPRILDGTYLSGLIIHEGQLTYVDHDLNVLIDLGKWWNARTNNWPMPLGGNVVRRDLGEEVMQDITKYTKMSIEPSNSPKHGAVESMTIPTVSSLACTSTTEPSITRRKVEHPSVSSSPRDNPLASFGMISIPTPCVLSENPEGCS
ncbi:MAG: MqnA/MqnD/SBP family protein, partial [Poseidonia sp.]